MRVPGLEGTPDQLGSPRNRSARRGRRRNNPRACPGRQGPWYDFAFNNSANKNVRKASHDELRRLFPKLRGEVWKLTLAPPLARLIAPHTWILAVVLSAVPFLRTHLLAVLLKLASTARH